MAQIAKEKRIIFKPTKQTLENLGILGEKLGTTTRTATIEEAIAIALATIQDEEKKSEKV